jgi:hypothetical protein
MTPRNILGLIGLCLLLSAGPVFSVDLGLLSIDSRAELAIAESILGQSYGMVGDRFIVTVSGDQIEELKRAGMDVEIALASAWPENTYLVLPPPKPIARTRLDVAQLGRSVALPDGNSLVQMGAGTASLTATTSAYKAIRLSDLVTDFHYKPPAVPAPTAPQSFPVDTLANLVLQDSVYAFDKGLEDFYTRYIWTDSIDRARDWMVQKFNGWGYTDVTTPTFDWDGGIHYNVMAIKYGVAEPEKVIVVGAHYDAITYNQTLPPTIYAPGSDDNGSGTTVVLELARILKDVPLRKTVIFMPFSAEEVGLVGSKAAAKAMRADGVDIEVMYNFDMVGFTGGQPFNLDLQSWPNDIYRNLTAAAANRVSGINPVYAALGGSSDHASFKNEGFDIVNSIETNFNSAGWHTELDLTSRMDFPYLTEVVKMALASVAIVAESPSPATVEGIVDIGDGQSLDVHWTGCYADNTYMIYRGTEPGVYIDSIEVGPGACSYVWNGLTDGERNYFLVIGISPDGYRSIYGVEGSEEPLVIPRSPSNFVAVADSALIRLSWTPNPEADLSHYRLYRRASEQMPFQLLHDNLTSSTYTDSSVLSQAQYQYYLTALDLDANESQPSDTISSYAATFDGGMVVADAFSVENQYIPSQSEQVAWLDSVFEGTPYGLAVVEGTEDSLTRSNVGPYSSLFWLDDDLTRKTIHNSDSVIAWYAGYNTNIAVSGYYTIIDWTNFNTQVPSNHLLYTDFLLDSYEYWGYSDFVGAYGQNGWPNVQIDPARGMDEWTNIPALTPRPGAEIIYTFNSASNYPDFEGKPVGLVYDGPKGKRVLLSFPIYNLTFSSARALVSKIVEYFGEEAVVWAPGDTNGDEAVDIYDLTRLIGYLYLGSPPSPQMNTMDVDGNCTMDVGDLTYMISYLYLEGPLPLTGCLE